VRKRGSILIAAGALLGGWTIYQQAHRFNPVVELLAAGKPAFGLYIPSNPRQGRGGGRGTPDGVAPAGAPAPAAVSTPPRPPVVVKTPAELAKNAVDYKTADYLFDGTMEPDGTFDRAFANFNDFVKGMIAAQPLQQAPSLRMTHPLFVKTPLIAPNPAVAAERISRQLNLGVSGIVFVGAESADEVKQGLGMMRFKSNGGTRPDDVGDAPAYWGMSEKEYKEKADLWPLNPNGELVNFTIVESKVGLAHVREIAAVKGIGALFPGAGTLGQVFSTVDSATGRRMRDSVGWEGAIQQVLSACKEFKVPCGYPANDSTVMTYRMKQGFSVFITGWSPTGFTAVDVGRKLGGRTDTP
jgi:2-keto-3-deoxy-L-rhamnonate aldolase RhmA